MTDVRFKNQAGLVLAGRLELPVGREAPPVVVFAHGFDSSKDSPRGLPVAERLRELGLATFLFDFTGHGDSQGAKMDSTIERQVDDLKAAIDFVTGADGIDPAAVGVNGASSGGLVALIEALDDDRVKAISLRGPRTDGLVGQAPLFKAPILIMQGEFDPLLSESTTFFQALRCDKKMEVIDGADHLFSQPDHLARVVELTGAWLKEKLA